MVFHDVFQMLLVVRGWRWGRQYVFLVGRTWGKYIFVRRFLETWDGVTGECKSIKTDGMGQGNKGTGSRVSMKSAESREQKELQRQGNSTFWSYLLRHSMQDLTEQSPDILGLPIIM